MNAASPTAETRAIEVAFGARAAGELHGSGTVGLALPLPALGEISRERLFGAARPAGESHGVRLFASEDFLVGWTTEPIGACPRLSAEKLYRRVIAAAGTHRLCRIWNYVPGINAAERGLETYRAFSAGRSAAFEEAYGPDFARRLPAASGVGCSGGVLSAVFAASDREPRHFENPEQVPAYRYPPEHGPKPPSFARATVVAGARRTWAFISGTAAIKGHVSVAAGDFGAQLRCTLDNLRLISGAAGLGSSLELPGGAERHFKVYVRRAGDFARARAELERGLLRPGDRVIWLQAELCRAELEIEIEATLIGAR